MEFVSTFFDGISWILHQTEWDDMIHFGPRHWISCSFHWIMLEKKHPKEDRERRCIVISKMTGCIYMFAYVVLFSLYFIHNCCWCKKSCTTMHHLGPRMYETLLIHGICIISTGWQRCRPSTVSCQTIKASQTKDLYYKCVFFNVNRLQKRPEISTIDLGKTSSPMLDEGFIFAFPCQKIYLTCIHTQNEAKFEN